MVFGPVLGADYSAPILLVKRLSDTETPLMILTQFAIFSTLLLTIPAIWVWKWPDAWGWTLAVAGCAWVIAMLVGVPIAIGIALFISHYAPRRLAELLFAEANATNPPEK